MDGIKASRVVCILVREPPRGWDPTAWAEACGRFSPQIALRGSEAVFLEMTGTSGLFGSNLPKRIQALGRRFGLSRLQIGEGPDAGSALVQARYPGRADRNALPLESLIDFGSPFRFDPSLQEKTLDLIRALRSLGIRNLGGFLALPSEGLASRFGQEISELALRLEATTDGRFKLPWPGFHPKPLISERADLSDVGTRDAIDGMEGLVFTLKGAIDRSMARLRGRGERASAVQVEFELENWSTIKNTRRRWKIVLPVPLGSAASLVAILQESLSYSLGQEPLEAPVQALHFTVLETVPGWGAQRDFFNRKEEEAEALDSLVGRLSHRLGKARVFVAQAVERYLPEEAWVKRLELERGLLAGFQTRGSSALKAEPAWPERPSRLLEDPVPLSRLGSILRDVDGKRRWRVLDWDGPERLSGEWWRSDSLDGFHRDYYRVKAETGERLWVYVRRTPSDQSETRAYLHGYFD